MAGANVALERLRVSGVWHFTQEGESATIMGANPAGQVLWRLQGSEPFVNLRFEWHPVAFHTMYRNAPAGLYNIAVILALMLRLQPLGGLTLHGSAQVVDGHGIICTGPSGRGKSTISKLFDQCGIKVLTDERPILRPCKGAGWRVYGSPWPSSGRFVINGSAPLKKIYFIEHGSCQEILPLTTREAILRLLDVALVPWLDPAFFDPMIPILENLLLEVPYALLRFRPDTSVIDLICHDLT